MGPELSEEEIEVMQRFTGFIANFVTYSNPNSDPNPNPNETWTAYKEEEGQYMVIDVPARSGMSRDLPFETKARPGRMEFWRQMFEYPENLADDYIFPEKQWIAWNFFLK